MKLYIFLPLIVLLTTKQLFARYEYAAAKGINDCTACHYSPVGGGAKTIFGKMTASHGFTPSKRSMDDKISGDFNAMALANTKDTTNNPTGISIMSGNVSGALDIIDNSEGKTHLVATYDFLGYASQAKEAFLRWETAKKQNIFPHHIIFGKFNIPYGIITDEHRSYVRLQTKTSVNDYEMGGLLSGNMSKNTHYDLAIVQGFQQAGSFPSSGVKWGIVPNIRILFPNSHLITGISGLYYKNTTTPSPKALATYLVWAPSQSFSLMTEIDYAENLNDPNIMNGYLSKFVDPSLSSTYYNQLLKKRSLGAMIRFDIYLNNKVTFFNKVDILMPDKNYTKDHYIKNGVGLKYYVSSNGDLQIVYEKNIIGRNGIEETNVSVSKDKIIGFAHVWF